MIRGGHKRERESRGLAMENMELLKKRVEPEAISQPLLTL